MRFQLWAVFMAVAVTAQPAFSGEAAYRSVMPDGTVVYGELPEPGAKQTKKIPAPRAATGTMLVTPQEREKARPSELQPGPRVVLPRPARASEPPLDSGVLQSPSTLPERRY